MADSDKKKGIFGKAIDAISSRDEKEKIAELEADLEKAKKEAEASKKTVQSLLSKNKETAGDKSEAEKEVKAAEKKIADLERKLIEHRQKEQEQLLESRKKAREERIENLKTAKKQDLIATHTVKQDETLSHIALKYYKHATPPYWKLLLEHNSDLLKGNERNVRTGMELEIPELPEELKD